MFIQQNNISRFTFITPLTRRSHPVDVLQLCSGRVYNDFIFAGRPDNSTELVPLTWRQADFYAHARTRFPVLQNLEFEILRGAPKSTMVEIAELTGTALKTVIPDGSYVRLWIRPMEAITHVPMGTPTVSILSNIYIVC